MTLDTPAATGLSAARALARCALRIRDADLTPAVLRNVQSCLLDHCACALTAGDLPWARQAVRLADTLRGRDDATVIGTAVRTGAADAAFANGVQAHGLVQEDMHPPSSSHLGVVVLPAVLAMAEARHASGRELACAVVAGYEVMGRLGRLLINRDNARVFRPTGTIGPVGAAAAVARLLGLDEDRTVQAIGLAGNQAVGLNQWPHTGTSEVFFHAGMAARNGVVSALLAQYGAEASESIIDGEAGMAVAYRASDPRAALRDDGGVPEILNIYFKPAPACNFVQTPCQVALSLLEGGRPEPQRIVRVEVHVAQAAAAYPGCDHDGPVSSIVQAKTSIQYSVAATLATGRLDEQNFRRLDDPVIAGLARRVAVHVDPQYTDAFPARQGARVAIVTVDGERREASLPDLVPLDAAGVRARFRRAATSALGGEAARAIEASVDALLDLRDAGELMRRLAVPAA